MRKMFLIFNHELTAEQLEDAKIKLNISEFVSLPNILQKVWANFPPEKEEIDTREIENWLIKNSVKNDVVLVQGDFGAVFKIVNFAIYKKMLPVYATTKRLTLEKILFNGVIEKTSVFRHVRFRKY